METIKDIIKQFYPILIMAGCLTFVLSVFFSASLQGKEGVFEVVGGIYVPILEGEKTKCNGLSYVEAFVSTDYPVIKYCGEVLEAGEYVSFQEQFEVISEDAVVTIELLDIKNQNGNFVYVKEQDILCCYASGIYTAKIKVYGENGSAKEYVVQIPVENS